MKKISKILGATAIVGLFLLSAVASTSLALTEEPAGELELSDGGCELMTDEEEKEYGIQPSGIILFPDLIPTGVSVSRVGAKYIKITIANEGRSMFYASFYTHFEVKRLGQDYSDSIKCKAWIWLKDTTRTFSIRLKDTIVGKHYVEVEVDSLNQIFEGFMGEWNNDQEFKNVEFGL